MPTYKVIRIYVVTAERKSEAIEKVRRAGGDAYLQAEFAKEVEATGWLGSVAKQLLGTRK